MPVLFVDKPATLAPDNKGATITYRSGNQTFVRRMSIADLRTQLADWTAALREFDAAERGRVVPLKRGRRDDH